MPQTDIYNLRMEKVGEISLSDLVFGAKPKPHLVHEVVRSQLVSRRAGTADTKTRGEVSFSTRKPYRQKKTGRARMGTRRSPLLKKGGVIFGPHPRDYSFRPPAKVRRQALISVLSSFYEEKRLIVIDNFSLEQPKTKEFAQSLAKLKFPSMVLCLPSADKIVELSGRNIPTVKVIRQVGLNCYDLLKYRHLVILKDAVPHLEARLLGNKLELLDLDKPMDKPMVEGAE
jgi:large subunit ribosomal protein L4